MNRPLGPRQPPDKRHAAYEDIFGRPGSSHHTAPNYLPQQYQQQQQQQQQHRQPYLPPPQYQYIPGSYAYPNPGPQPNQPSVSRARSVVYPGGTVRNDPTDPPYPRHINNTQNYPPQQIYPPNGNPNRTGNGVGVAYQPSAGPSSRPNSTHSLTNGNGAPRLGVSLDHHNDGRLGLDFTLNNTTPPSHSSSDQGTDEDSELPWARNDVVVESPSSDYHASYDARSSITQSPSPQPSISTGDHSVTLVGHPSTSSRHSLESASRLSLGLSRRDRAPQDHRSMSMSAATLPSQSQRTLDPRRLSRPPVHDAPAIGIVRGAVLPPGLGTGPNTPSSPARPSIRKSPLVYPALLSRVAEAFRDRIPLSDRVKDGLTYKDAFDGREAVDKIAYIIKTTDRNLALLLGRALDAQKFFHDVTYDHRLRDSSGELYQFRTKLASPFVSGDLETGVEAVVLGEVPSPAGGADSSAEEKGDNSPLVPPRPRKGSITSDDIPLPSGEPGTLWIHSVPQEIVNSVSDAEKRRQEAINEVIYTERDFVRDMEYLRDTWIGRLKDSDVIPSDRRTDFLTQVFWNLHEIIAVNTRLRDALNKRQKSYAVVERIGDVLLESVPHFAPFVKYGAHQLYGKYEFEKEKNANAAFAQFVETTERLPESRKLELNAYLTKPTTRLARYPLLLEAVLKHTPDESPDKTTLPKVIIIVRDFLKKVNEESGKTENRFNLMQLEQQLVFRPGEQADLRLGDEGRQLIGKDTFSKRDGDIQVYMFDHALLFTKPVKTKQHEQFKVYRRPIPLELLLIAAPEDAAQNANRRGKHALVRRHSLNRISSANNVPPIVVRTEAKGQNWINFMHLGRKFYNLVLWAPTPVLHKKWLDLIVKQQSMLRERSLIFDTTVLNEGFFFGPNKVNCAAPYNGGRKIVYGTNDGVYISDLQSGREPVRVLALLDVSQVDVLEDYQLLIVLSERQVITFPLDALNPKDPTAGLKNAKRISSHTSFFKAGFCLGRVLVCIVKSSQLSSTFKTLEPIDQNIRGRSKPTLRKMLQGGNDTLKLFREFYIPVESTSIHYLKTKMCVGCSRGFEIVDLESLDTQGLLDPNDENLEFVRKRENLRPMAIYRIHNEFLLCYDEFAFYVNKNGRQSRKDFMVYWEGNPTGFGELRKFITVIVYKLLTKHSHISALHEPYVLAFEPSFVEVRHIETGLLAQVIQGANLRLLFADTPPSVTNTVSPVQPQSYPHMGGYDHQNPYAAPNHPGYGGFNGPPYGQYPNPNQYPVPRNPQGIGREEILIVSDDRVLALRPTAGSQRPLSDSASMMSIPR
ncbi:hypothetical protein H0H93_004038 [Arthromyces matolae]|nr:hypothetical protein H0H93_004038 [Arthromyces matolae]